MLADLPMKGISRYALDDAQNELFGVKSPDIMKGIKLFLIAYAQSKSQLLTTVELRTLNKKAADINL